MWISREILQRVSQWSKMSEAIKVFSKILTNILIAFYEPFGFSILLSFFAMFFYLYAYEPTNAGKGWKNAMMT